jgi:hypothetical protein
VAFERFVDNFLLRRILMEAAATVPEEIVPVMRSAMLAKHSGHICDLESLSRKKGAAVLRPYDAEESAHNHNQAAWAL